MIFSFTDTRANRVFVISLLLRHWFLSAHGRCVWEGLILRLPVVGLLVARFAMVRFCRMLGTLLAAGVPLVQALQVARQSIGNQILVDAVANRDYAVIQALALIMAAVYVFLNLAADILTILITPRLRTGLR